MGFIIHFEYKRKSIENFHGKKKIPEIKKYTQTNGHIEM